MQRLLQEHCQNNDHVSRDYSHIDEQTQDEEQVSEGPKVCKQSELKVGRVQAAVALHVCSKERNNTGTVNEMLLATFQILIQNQPACNLQQLYVTMLNITSGKISPPHTVVHRLIQALYICEERGNINAQQGKCSKENVVIQHLQ